MPLPKSLNFPVASNPAPEPVAPVEHEPVTPHLAAGEEVEYVEDLPSVEPQLSAGEADFTPEMESVQEQAPAPALPSAPHINQDHRYQSVGILTAEELLNTPFSHWEHLEADIQEMTEWIQKSLSDQQITGKVSEARREGGELLDEMHEFLDGQVLTRMNQRNIRLTAREKSYFIARVVNEILGLGPLDPLWKDNRITEIMVNGPERVRVEIAGKLVDVPGVRFRSKTHLLNLCNYILAGSNRALNNSNPYEDGRLPDMSRVNAVHHVIAPGGPGLTIRRSRSEIWTIKELAERNAFTPEIAAELVNLIHAGCSTVVVGGTGSGKALALDTPIPTPEGFVTMGDLKVGDKVLDAAGAPTNVTAVYDQGVRPAYELTFSDGTTVVADAEHNWLTYTRAARRSLSRAASGAYRRRRFGTDEELAVIEEFATREQAHVELSEVTHRLPRYRRHLMSALEPDYADSHEALYAAADAVLCLRGKAEAFVNGQEHKRILPEVVTTKDIIDTLYTSTGHANHSVQVVSTPVEFPERQLAEDPYEFGKKVAAGSVTTLPSEYLFSSVEQRQALLAGVMDVRGTVRRNSSTLSLVFPVRVLAESVSVLVNSLGLVSTLVDKGDGGFELRFRSDRPVFRDVAKAKRHADAHKESPRDAFRYITAAREVTPRETRCITVDNEDHLYLCSTAFIPTHNTTVLNALSGAMPADERIITIEDNLELKLHPDRDSFAMEARPASASGQGAVTIRDLVKNSLRMRPNRIIVGEVRDSAAFDMLQAMNTGHEGSMTTFHANGPDEAMDRLASMVATSGEVDAKGAVSLIASAIDILVMIARYEDGSRRLSGVYEIPMMPEKTEGGDYRLTPRPLFEFVHDSTDEQGNIIGHYEKINDLSERLVKRHRLDKRRHFTVEEAYAISDLGL